MSKREDQQAAYHDIALFNNSREGGAESGEEFHRELLQSVSYRFFEHAFPVVFWFAILGVPGALLYRLTGDTSESATVSG